MKVSELIKKLQNINENKDLEFFISGNEIYVINSKGDNDEDYQIEGSNLFINAIEEKKLDESTNLALIVNGFVGQINEADNKKSWYDEVHKHKIERTK